MTPAPIKAAPTEEVSWLGRLGPGLVTGAADDDPSGIATYSQAGAQSGFAMLWTVVLTYPLMVAIQLISARIGQVTGHGLATNIRRHFPHWLLYGVVMLLLIANTINIAADISAMGDAATLLMGGSSHAYVIIFGLLSIALQVFIPYSRYVKGLKWLTLTLLTYVATIFSVHIPWAEVGRQLVAPGLQLDSQSITLVVAILGTTISPYMFFWQASQEVEEQRAHREVGPLDKASDADGERVLKRIRVDTLVGMAFSNLVAFFIILTTAVTLHEHGITRIATSAEAASALRPIAGDFAFLLFALGIVGTGLLAIPVLAGSAAYAMAGTFRWDNSLEHRPQAARRFYGIIAASTVIGMGIGFTPVEPIKALFWSAVINGVISVPIMIVMMLLSSRRQIMGRYAVAGGLRVVGWTATALMTVVTAALFWVSLR